jgi:hypothetical protein
VLVLVFQGKTVASLNNYVGYYIRGLLQA